MDDRWEMGSEFHWDDRYLSATPDQPWQKSPPAGWGAALQAAVAQREKWRGEKSRHGDGGGSRRFRDADPPPGSPARQPPGAAAVHGTVVLVDVVGQWFLRCGVGASDAAVADGVADLAARSDVAGLVTEPEVATGRCVVEVE